MKTCPNVPETSKKGTEAYNASDKNSEKHKNYSWSEIAKELHARCCKTYTDNIKMQSSHCEVCAKLIFQAKRQTCTTNNVTAALDLKKDSILCSKCKNQCDMNKIPMHSKNNELFCGEIPKQLLNLTLVEKRMIALIQVFLTLLVLPGGQLAEKGLSICIPVDINNQLSHLPPIQETTNTIGIAFSSSSDAYKQTPLPVNLPNIYAAIQWLKENNHLYSDVTVDKSYSENDMAENDSRTFDEKSTDLSNIPFYSLISENVYQPNLAVKDMYETNMGIPQNGNRPVNIIDVECGEEKTFPWLFPYGTGGIGTKRNTQLTDLQYYNCRLYHKDNRWRKDIPYLMFSVNHFEQRKLWQQVSICLRSQFLFKKRW